MKTACPRLHPKGVEVVGLQLGGLPGPGAHHLGCQLRRGLLDLGGEVGTLPDQTHHHQ